MSILIVGDSFQERIHLKDILTKEGFTDLSVAETAKAAFEYLKADAEDIELILMGSRMPDMSGIEACRLIKVSEDLHDIPVIIVSETPDMKNLKLAFAVGATDYIAKPVREIELLARVRSSLRLKHEMDMRKTREEELLEATRELKTSKQNIERANDKMMESIRYALMIQHSLLPNANEVKSYLPHSLFLWVPRDVVGGDIFFIEFFRDGFVAAVLDCTGHGVPGAFLTMIASSALKRIVKDEGVRLPAQALKRLNVIVKTTLRQDTEYAISDDGLDAAICFVRLRHRTLLFSGARLSLISVYEDQLKLIKGDRQSIGYKRSDLDFEFTNHTISIENGMAFYMYTDGFTDQLGGEKGRMFGTRRFKNLIQEIASLPFDTQRKMLIETFDKYRGTYERQDDLTVVGFGFQ